MGHFIIGTTHNSNKFRPSDWAERLASACGHFDERCRLHYNPMLKPAKHDGIYGLFVASKLGALNPEAYHYAMDFAYRNHLQVIDIGMRDSMPDAA
jgi:hypothetical protein